MAQIFWLGTTDANWSGDNWSLADDGTVDGAAVIPSAVNNELVFNTGTTGFNAATFSTNNDLGLTDISISFEDLLGLGDFSIGGNAIGLSATAGTPITSNDPVGGSTIGVPLTLASNSIFEVNAGSLSLGGTISGSFDLTINSADTVNIAANVNVNSLTTDANGTTAFGAGVTTVTTAGTQTYNDDVTLAAAATTFASAGNLAISFNGTLTGAGAATTVNTTGTTTFGGNVSVGSLTTNALGTTAFGAGVTTVTTAGLQTYNDDVTLAAATTTFESTGNLAISFNGTLTGAGTATTVNTTGTTTFGGNVSVGSLTTNALGTTAFGAGVTTVTTAGPQTYNDDVTLAAAATTFESTGNLAISFNGTLTGAGTATTVNTTGTTTFGGNVSVGSLTTNALGTTAINGGLVITAANQTFNDDVILDAAANATTLTGVDIFFTGTVRSAIGGEENLTISGSGLTTFLGAVGDGGQRLASLTTNGGGTTDINGGSVTTTEGQTYDDAVELSVNLTTLSDIGATGITFNNTLDADDAVGQNRALIINAAAAVSFNNLVGSLQALADLDVTAATINLNGGTITANDGPGGATATLTGASVLGADTTVTTDGTSDNSFSFAGTVNNSTLTPRTLTVNAGSGAATFGGSIGAGANGAIGALAVNSTGITTFGGTVAAASVTTNAGGATAINGGSVTTTGGNQTYGDAVTLNAGGNATTLTGVDIFLANTVRSTTDGEESLTINGSGVTTFAGAVGDGGQRLNSLTTSGGGTTAINGGSVTTTVNQSYNEPVTLGVTAALTSASGDIGFTSTLDGSGGLNATAAVGNVSIAGTTGGISPLASLTITANDISLASIGPSAATAGVTGDSIVIATTSGGDTGSIAFTGVNYIVSGNSTYDVVDTGVAGENIQVPGGVTIRSLLASITLRGGDDITINNNATVLATGSLLIFGDTGGDAGTIITIDGSLGLIGGNAGGTIRGNAQDDTIITAPVRFRGGNSLTQQGMAGNDRFRLNYLSNFDGPGVITPYTVDGGSGTTDILDVNTSTDTRSRKNQFTYTTDGSGDHANFLTNVSDPGGFTNAAEANWTLTSLDQYVVRNSPGGLDQTVIVGQKTGFENEIFVGDVVADRPSGTNRFGVVGSELIRVLGGALPDDIKVDVTAASQARFVILEGLGSSIAGDGEILQGTRFATNLIFGASNTTTLKGEAGANLPIGDEPARARMYGGGFTTADPNIRDFIFADYFRRIDPLSGQGLALGQLLGGNFRDIIQSGNSVVQAAGTNDRLGQDPTQIGSGSITAFFNGSQIDVISWLRARFPGITELGINVADAGTFGSAEFLVKDFDHRLINSVSAPLPPPAGIGIGAPIFTAPANVNLGDQVNLSASGATGNGLTYRWTITQPDLTTFALTGKDVSFVARFPGSYKVALTVANSDGASAVLAPQFVSSNPIAGNVVNATVSSGLLTLTGTVGVNDVVIELGTAGMNSARVKGQNGTQIKFGATTFASGTFVPFTNLSRGINTSMLGGADRLVLSGTNLRSAVRLDGGAGDDAYVISTRNIQVTLADSGGSDVLNFAGMTAGINLDLSQSTGLRRTLGGGNTFALTGNIETAVGTQFADTLTGSPFADVLVGLGGNDFIFARGGNDHVDGGAGNDSLFGEQGTDRIYGGEGGDSISGGTEGDILLGEGGNDNLTGDDGNDFLIGGFGLDTLRGGLGDDILTGGGTQHDYYDIALLSILHQHGTVNPTSVRVGQIRSGQTSGAFDLRIARTLNDGAADSLFGESGNDWFLAKLAEPDQLRDLESSRDFVDR